MNLFRLFSITRVILRFGLEEFVLGCPFFFARKLPRALRLRLALERLGPIFVKFGQMLSTRRDLIPLDIADELARLQDQVPPFPTEQVREVLLQAYQQPINEVFAEFEIQPIASASVAQVHFAKLHNGLEVAVKILRPGIATVIKKDLSLLDAAAWLLEKASSDGRRLKPREVVAEFSRHIHNELDLLLEAANCSELRRNFVDGKLLIVPEVYWDFCREQVMVMERMYGTPISQVATLRERGVDIPKLARDGVEIFFTQVFRDGFFHADMHPGNIQVATDPAHLGRYVALDFGIMGTLTEIDKNYLARNFLGFFRRDYGEVARAHIESGWAPPDTHEDEFEAAIRSVCEPIFDKPLKDISFGRLLLRLFQTSRRFGVEIQPQLVMLQKTLLNIEGLGRDLDPELDLWKTAKPYLERWMSEQLGWRSAFKNLKKEIPYWGAMLPQVPRLIHQRLAANPSAEILVVRKEIETLKRQQKQRERITIILLVVLILIELIRLKAH